MRRLPSSRRRVVEVVLALVGLASIVAMHGVSAHASALQHAVASSAPAAPSHHDGASSHHHDDGARDGACDDCRHGAASMCALIVAGALVAPPRPARFLGARIEGPIAPAVLAFSPDPPVPRSAVFIR